MHVRVAASEPHRGRGSARLDVGDLCTCTDKACPFHPSNHDKGCTPCIAKCLSEREVPSCMFNMVGRSARCSGYRFEDFALSVVDAQRASGETDVIARADALAFEGEGR